MATTVRKLYQLVALALADEWNKLRNDLVVLVKDTSIQHFDTVPLVASLPAYPTNTATCISCATALTTGFNAHLASHVSATTGQGAHRVADASNPVATSVVDDIDKACTRLSLFSSALYTHESQTGVHINNDVTAAPTPAACHSYDQLVAQVNHGYTDYEAHRILTTSNIHLHADATNVTGTSTATNLATSITRINALVTNFLAHSIMVGAGGSQVHLASGATALTAALAALPVASDRATAYAAAVAFQAAFNEHCANTTAHTVADATNPMTDTDVNEYHSAVLTATACIDAIGAHIAKGFNSSALNLVAP